MTGRPAPRVSWRSPWELAMAAVFLAGSGFIMLVSIYHPPSIGSHAANYTAAAAAWLAGSDPWLVGPPAAVFAGPPPMLVPFVPFVGLPADVTRIVWVGGCAVLAILTLRRLRLPGLWLGFPPIFQAIMLGHVEMVVLWLLVVGGPASGLGALVKPYAGLALVAERRWVAIAVAVAVAVASLVVLPWGPFLDALPRIGANLQAQSHGDSVFGQPVLMLVAVLALASLGLRRALWLAVPVLWPGAQPLYKVVTVPALSRLLVIAWSLPIPGATLGGLVAEAVLIAWSRHRVLPSWVASGLGPVSPWYLQSTDQAAPKSESFT